jgi:hypothetical protein
VPALASGIASRLRGRAGARIPSPPRSASGKALSPPRATRSRCCAAPCRRPRQPGSRDWQIRLSAARTLAALLPEESEPEPEPEPETVVYDLPPGSSPILHCAPPPIFLPATTTEPPAEPLPEPGHYFFQGEAGPLILLVKHTLVGDEAQTHFLTSHEAAADILRAFGGDPRILDPIPDADPQPNTP